jgi:spermidine synthase
LSPYAAERPGTGGSLTFPLVTAVFFLSGSAGLIYQVLWMRGLGLFFGSDMYGVSIILSVFMGGLAIGSLFGGRLAERTRRPLLWYGMVEVAIGLAAIPFTRVLALLDPMLRSAYPEAAEGAGAAYQTARVVLAASTLLVPTTLMGATLPLILKQFVHQRSALGESGAYFYAANTLGALAGTLSAGFLLLPYLGMARSTLCVAAVNLGIGALSIALGWRSPLPPPVPEAREHDAAFDPLPGLDARTRSRLATAAVLAFGLSGFGSFALEVAWTRVLLRSFSATVYSFATTLACFLFGIFLGTRMISRVVDQHERPVSLFAMLELGLGASIAALGVVLYAMPGVFGRPLGAVAGVLPQEHALVAATLLASFPLLVIPATLLGATFPLALRIHTTTVAHVGRGSGDVYAANTVGAVLGSLAAGLLLIPALGARATIVLLAFGFLGIGVFLARLPDGPGGPGPARRWIAPAGAITLLCGVVALLLPYRVTLNFNQQRPVGAELLYHGEGVQNTIDVVRSANGITSLIIGGNVEADDGYSQRRHFVLKGHLPLLLIPEPKSVLVVGLGMGITLEATARHPGLERIEVVELSPEILDAQSELAAVNGDVAANPIVRIRIDDGRLFMRMTQDRYDMITADPIHPKISRVGYLYTKEYYETIRERLAPGGVVCQWMPIYQIAPTRLRSAIKTFQSVFPEATLWYVEGHALLMAQPGRDAIDADLVRRRFEAEAVRADLASIDIETPEELLRHQIMGPAELSAYLAADSGVPLNTDDYPYLEYFVPRDLFHGTDENVRELARYAIPGSSVRDDPEPSVP